MVPNPIYESDGLDPYERLDEYQSGAVLGQVQDGVSPYAVSGPPIACRKNGGTDFLTVEAAIKGCSVDRISQASHEDYVTMKSVAHAEETQQCSEQQGGCKESDDQQVTVGESSSRYVKYKYSLH